MRRYTSHEKHLQEVFSRIGFNNLHGLVKVINVFADGKKPSQRDLDRLVRYAHLFDRLRKIGILEEKKGNYYFNKNRFYELAEEVFESEPGYF